VYFIVAAHLDICRLAPPLFGKKAWTLVQDTPMYYGKQTKISESARFLISEHYSFCGGRSMIKMGFIAGLQAAGQSPSFPLGGRSASEPSSYVSISQPLPCLAVPFFMNNPG
jgi:hypothetical protein